MENNLSHKMDLHINPVKNDSENENDFEFNDLMSPSLVYEEEKKSPQLNQIKLDKIMTNVDNKATTNVIINNMKTNANNLNKRYTGDEWSRAEQKLSELEQNIINTIKAISSNSSYSSNIENVSVLGEQFYNILRDAFNKDDMNLTGNVESENIIDDKKDKKKKPSTPKPGTPKAKGMGKADLIRSQSTNLKILDIANNLSQSFTKTKIKIDTLFCNSNIEYMETRILLLCYISWFILNGPEELTNRKSFKSKIYELICTIQRFINFAKDYKSSYILNKLVTEPIAKTSIIDINYWLNQLLEKYPFDGLNIYKNAPKLLIYSDFDNIIPSKGISIRPNQLELLNQIRNNIKNGFLIFYNAMIGSGKTTLASVGIPALLAEYRKTLSGVPAKDLPQLLFCCNIDTVRNQVARYAYNAEIPFGVASISEEYQKNFNTIINRFDEHGRRKPLHEFVSQVNSTRIFTGNNKLKITNSYNCQNDDVRLLVIAGPEATYSILSDKQYRDKFWLFLDEPTTGADQDGSNFLINNTSIIANMPKHTILSSATMPLPEKIPSIMKNHLERNPNISIHELITSELSIGCDLFSHSGEIVIPHMGCKNKEELTNVLNRLKEVPFLYRLYTMKIAYSLYQSMIQNEITNITNINEYFGNINNLSMDKIRHVCNEYLNTLLNYSDDIIENVCSSKILSDVTDDVVEDIEISEDSDDIVFDNEEETETIKVIDNKVNFNKILTSDACKYMRMNLIVTLDPIKFAQKYFSKYLDLIRKTNIKAYSDDNKESQIKSFARLLEVYRKELHNYNNELDKLNINYDNTFQKSYSENDGLLRAFKVGSQKQNKSSNEKNINKSWNTITRKDVNDSVLEMPRIKFPNYFQINTPSHYKSFGKGNCPDTEPEFRTPFIFTEDTLPVECVVEDWIMLLLMAGVGIYAPTIIKCPVYHQKIIELAEEGKLAYLLADTSISYGTNYPINRVFVVDDFDSVHSINTLFQLLGRAGRVGKSWKAEAYISDNLAKKLINFTHNPNDPIANVEANNLESCYVEYVQKVEDINRRNEEAKIKAKIEAEKEKLLELERIKKMNEEAEKARIEAINNFNKNKNKIKTEREVRTSNFEKKYNLDIPKTNNYNPSYLFEKKKEVKEIKKDDDDDIMINVIIDDGNQNKKKSNSIKKYLKPEASNKPDVSNNTNTSYKPAYLR